VEIAMEKEMNKRDHGEGSWHLREDGVWQHNFTVPGKGRVSVYGKTKAICREKRRQREKLLFEGARADGGKKKLSEFLADWLEAKKPKLEPSSYIKYEGWIRTYVNPTLGSKRLDQLTPQVIQRFYADLSQKVAASTMHGIHTSILKAPLDRAVQWGLLPRNPCQYQDLPKIHKAESRVFTRQEARRLLEAIDGDSNETLWRVALFTGLRLGELLALRWQDVSLSEGYMTISQNCKRNYNGRMMGEPKTRAGNRRIEIGPDLVQKLRAHRAGQLAMQEAMGPEWREHDLVFCSGHGTPLSPNHVRARWWYGLLDKHDLPRVKPHGVRKSFGSILAQSGVPLPVVKELMGHADIQVTSEHYIFVDSGARREAMQRLEEILTGAR
jgi:integrase